MRVGLKTYLHKGDAMRCSLIFEIIMSGQKRKCIKMRMKEGKNENKRANERTDLESLLFFIFNHRAIPVWGGYLRTSDNSFVKSKSRKREKEGR
jgi:hypothetical protein